MRTIIVIIINPRTTCDAGHPGFLFYSFITRTLFVPLSSLLYNQIVIGYPVFITPPILCLQVCHVCVCVSYVGNGNNIE